ncbi:MAG: metallophosphoesterase family protein [Bacillales bacterium]|nr:metallophosphoesterase family protein [Bacillales bacterium]
MKAAFISDIHGNVFALEAVLDDIAKKQIDQIFLLGDLCFRGPNPKQALDLIRSLNANVIKGNADEWVVRGIHKGEVPDEVLDVMRKEREWTVAHLDAMDIDYLQNLPETLHLDLNGTDILAFHATPNSLFDIIRPDTDDFHLEKGLMAGNDAHLFIYGHIHLPYIRFLNGKAVLNIGSVGLPFDGQAKASYGIVAAENGNVQVSIERVNYDIEKTVQQYLESDYPNNAMVDVVRNGRL